MLRPGWAARRVLVTIALAALLGILLDRATRSSPPMEKRGGATLAHPAASG